MKTEHQLRSEYSDVLDAAADASLVRLVGRLDGALATERYAVPDRLTAAVDRLVNGEAARAARKERGWRRLLPPLGLPHTRMGWVVASLMLLVALGAGGYGIGSQVIGLESFGALTGQKPYLVRDLGYTQTIDELSFTLERVYVTGDRIGVDVLVTGMPEPYQDESGLNHRFFPTANLIALDGIILETVGGSIVNRAERDTVGQHVGAYEMSRPQGASSDLPLRAEISVIELSWVAGDVADWQTFAGPVVFEFTVPLEGVRFDSNASNSEGGVQLRRTPVP